MGRRSRLAASALALILAGGPAFSAGLTPPNMPAATTANNGDLFMIWPVASSGPINQIAWSVLKAQMTSALGASYLQTTNNLSDIPNFTTARTNLGLGSAATVNTGASGATLCLLNAAECDYSGTVGITGAAGAFRTLAYETAGLGRWDIVASADPESGANAGSNFQLLRFADAGTYVDAPFSIARSTGLASFVDGLSVTGAFTVGGKTPLYASNNLSDLVSASTARTNLGLGTAAVANVGTGAGTVAAGNDTRITGALQASNNLSDVANASTARTNLGLGGAATLSVGTGAGTVAAGNDSRFGGVTQNSESGAYPFALTDAGGQVYHPPADTTARTWTIPANGSVAFPVGTKIDVVNDCLAGVLTIAITTDTLVLFPAGTTGSRTVAACGEATLTKVGSTRWIIIGTGVS